MKAQVEKLKEIRKAQEQAAEDLAFEQFLADSDSPEYQQCLEAIPSLARKPGRKNTFAAAMRKAWLELVKAPIGKDQNPARIELVLVRPTIPLPALGRHSGESRIISRSPGRFFYPQTAEKASQPFF